MISLWSVADALDDDVLVTTCHGSLTQAFVDTANALHLVTYQRSADVVCGVPHNWLAYWAFLMWLAQRCGRNVGTLTYILGDAHLYQQYEYLAKLLVQQTAVVSTPQLVYRPTTTAFIADDFSLSGTYSPVLDVRAEMVV